MSGQVSLERTVCQVDTFMAGAYLKIGPDLFVGTCQVIYWTVQYNSHLLSEGRVQISVMARRRGEKTMIRAGKIPFSLPDVGPNRPRHLSPRQRSPAHFPFIQRNIAAF